MYSSCDAKNDSTTGFPVRHQLPESTQTHVHRVSDAIQPSHPLLSPSPPAPQSLPASGSFPMSQLFVSGGQSTGLSASTSVLPMNTQDWSPLGWTDWISLQSKGLSRVFSNTTVQKHQFFGAQLSLWKERFLGGNRLSHSHMTTQKTITLAWWNFVGKVMSLFFNMLSRLVIAFLPRSKCLNFMAVVTICSDFEDKKIKSLTVFIISPSICHEMMGLDAMILVFWMLSFKPAFSLCFTSSGGSLVLLHFLP